MGVQHEGPFDGALLRAWAYRACAGFTIDKVLQKGARTVFVYAVHLKYFHSWVEVYDEISGRKVRFSIYRQT